MTFTLSCLSRRALLWVIVLSAACLSAGFYLAVSMDSSNLTAGAADESSADPSTLVAAGAFRPATVSWAWYSESDEIDLQVYKQHIDTHFRLLAREVGDQLELVIQMPPSYASSKDLEWWKDSMISFHLRDDFFYNTVRRPEDCNSRLFRGNYVMRVEEPSTQLFLPPFSASDRGRYYCVKIGLKVIAPKEGSFTRDRKALAQQSVCCRSARQPSGRR